MAAFNLGAAFAAVVARHGERTALLYPAESRRISYRELDDLSRRIAASLSTRGIEPGAVIALFHDKSAAAYASMLACLRLGLPYVNLDPDSPWERIRRIVDNCAPALVINACSDLRCGEELVACAKWPMLTLDQVMAMEPLGWAERADVAVTGSMPAYLMFTSGSTGQPKGAVISHANVLWFIAWARQRFSVTELDVLSNANPMYFDNSAFDFYTALFTGATLVPLSAAEVREPRQLVRLVDAARCTLWFSVPSLLVFLLTMRALGPTQFTSLRCIAFGGEGFPKRRLRELFELYGQRLRLENVYGPTECTCICSAYRITAKDFADMQGLAPLGQLAPNFSYRLLPIEGADPDSGELFLLGPQVGLGYYGDAERTSRSFIQNPAQDAFIEVGYRTGDIVHRDAQGLLHFRGRIDHQIKHMGYRIELEEIEAALGSLPGVQECAVVYARSVDGMGQITAAVVLEPGVDAAGLAEALAMLLPAYMLPRRVQLLAALPKNANGKIDRPALLAQLQTGTHP